MLSVGRTYCVCQNFEGQRFTNTSLFWERVQPSIRNTGKHGQKLVLFFCSFKYLNSSKYGRLQRGGANALVLTFLKREILTSCLGKCCCPCPLTWAAAGLSPEEAAGISDLPVNSSLRPGFPASAAHENHPFSTRTGS